MNEVGPARAASDPQMKRKKIIGRTSSEKRTNNQSEIVTPLRTGLLRCDQADVNPLPANGLMTMNRDAVFAGMQRGERIT